MLTNRQQARAHLELDAIFQTLFPSHGLPERPAQRKLSHEMLAAMSCGKTALCEAGTGIGKTYAYLAAAFLCHRHRGLQGLAQRPILISTSSIALQRGLVREYLPFLSRVLEEGGLLSAPISVVTRKGKSHYVCDRRLEQRLSRVNPERKNRRNLEALYAMRQRLDLDEAPLLSTYDGKKIAVPEVCDCGARDCRYLRFLRACRQEGKFLFQICNHNLLLADAIHRRDGHPPILPDSDVLIIDEAHKLPEAARQMFGSVLSREAFRSVIDGLKQEQYLLAAQNLSLAAQDLLHHLAELPEETCRMADYLGGLDQAGRMLEKIQHHLNGLLTVQTSRQLDRLCRTVRQFTGVESQFLYYVTEDDAGGSLLCATANDLAGQLRHSLWKVERPVILTSGTLAAGGSFHHYRRETGLTDGGKVAESTAASPFSYREHCLLYLPERPPQLPDGDRQGYYGELAEEIARLLQASCGHGLVLFTSYTALTAVRELLARQNLTFPIFAAGRKQARVLEQFRATPGSVLLATGAFWEGMDFPGDCVSMLIIPRLPFSFPDARQQRMRENYPSLQAYIRSVSVPEMQIKLRQGFGRAIRTETDTCVVAILDERACPGQRYHRAVLEALPEMPVTGDLQRVAGFYRAVKTDTFCQNADLSVGFLK